MGATSVWSRPYARSLIASARSSMSRFFAWSPKKPYAIPRFVSVPATSVWSRPYARSFSTKMASRTFTTPVDSEMDCNNSQRPSSNFASAPDPSTWSTSSTTSSASSTGNLHSISSRCATASELPKRNDRKYS